MMQRAAENRRMQGGANESAVAAQAMSALFAESAANAVRLAARDPAPLDPIPTDEVAALRSRIAALETEAYALRLYVAELEASIAVARGLIPSGVAVCAPDGPGIAIETPYDPVRGMLGLPDSAYPELCEVADPRPPPPLPARALGPQHQTVGNGGRLTGLWR